MREVVIIGGGLSGLAAAYELIQHKITPTLIEVKPRLGGGIISHAQDGFIMDGGPMLHPIQDEAFFMSYLDQLGLADSVAMTPDGLLFINGTGALIDTLARRLAIPIMSRMAVSTLGELDHRRYSICLENGMLLDARAVIVAAPARYAERLFYPLDPAISQRLLDFAYAPVVRLSLGYTKPFEIKLDDAANSSLIALQQTRHPGRVPPGGFLVQLALPQPDDYPPMKLSHTGLRILTESTEQPVIQWDWRWEESDPLGWQQQNAENMQFVVDRLPARVALCGSDYMTTRMPPTLDQRIRRGILTARAIVEQLS